MTKCYFELRKQSARGTDSIAADIMRHLHARQHLGKVVILCDQSIPMLAAARKQWLKLTRAIQRQRASTLNSDKILKYTHTITHMQHMRFSHKAPMDEPGADVYFVEPDELQTLPAHCYTMYTTCGISDSSTSAIIEQLPSEALIVDYAHAAAWGVLGLQPKTILEQQVASEWSQVRQFLSGRNIHIADLLNEEPHNVELMDDALDTLLGISHQFLRIANEFQRALELARPLRISQALRKDYDAVVLLAYRVQALSPGAFTQRFLETYNEDDTFFLYDIARQRFVGSGQSLRSTVSYHVQAGRHNLANALQAQALSC